MMIEAKSKLEKAVELLLAHKIIGVLLMGIISASIGLLSTFDSEVDLYRLIFGWLTMFLLSSSLIGVSLYFANKSANK
jgi:4-hydroxybenzoate polyprenyltransferase